MKRLLWIGDAVSATGFARCTHKILDVLKDSYEVSVLGLCYLGDPHEYQYKIYPTWPGGDAFGIGRVGFVMKREKPDLIIIQNDPWNIPAYIREIRAIDKNIPIIGAVAVDGKNCRGKDLNDLALAIFWTEFAAQEARQGGHTGAQAVVGLGVDLDIYKPTPTREARSFIGIPEPLLDSFIVGNVNRNQPRKRLDLMISYFAEWVKSFRVENAYLYLHVAPTGDDAWNLQQLMQYYGFTGSKKRLIQATPETAYGISEEELAKTYSCFDVMMTTTQGEGWGLPTMEAMACGVPQIVPKWSALEEWCGDAAVQITCSEIAMTVNRINTIGGIPNRFEMIEALDKLYRNPQVCAAYSAAGMALVAQERFRWQNIGREYQALVKEVIKKEMLCV
jgi:D-inositol-3-phosphate glycosyltransferase